MQEDLMVSNFGFGGIRGFGLFRANPSGDEHWIKATSDQFLVELDKHLDEALVEYDALIKTIVQSSKLLDDGTLLDRHTFAAHMIDRFPFTRTEPFPDFGELWDPQTRKDELAVLQPAYLVFPHSYAIDAFVDWRALSRDELLALCRDKFQQLQTEHRHLEATLAVIVNRARDVEGYWGVGPSEIKRHFAYAFWRWPGHEEDLG